MNSLLMISTTDELVEGIRKAKKKTKADDDNKIEELAIFLLEWC